MILNDFLRALNARLAHEQTGATVPGWQIQPDPLRRRAEPEQILIGVGVWGTTEQPVEHDGVCLNNKGLAGRFGLETDPATVTELALDPPPELAAHWRAVWGEAATLDRRLGELTLVVEDAAPDSTLALLFWLALVNGVAVDTQPGGLLDLPSVQRYLAALIARRDEQPITVQDLPQPSEFTVVLLHGGFAIVYDQGVLVFDDWGTERLRLKQLGEEFERVFQTLGRVRHVETELDAIFQEHASGKKTRPAVAVLSDLR